MLSPQELYLLVWNSRRLIETAALYLQELPTGAE